MNEETVKELAARTTVEIRGLIKENLGASNDDIERFDKLALTLSVTEHPDYCTAEHMLHVNLSYLHNLRDGTIRYMLTGEKPNYTERWIV